MEQVYIALEEGSKAVMGKLRPAGHMRPVRFPAGSGILISVLGLGACPLSVFCPVLSAAEALTLC